jgi:ADP-heptose:LPS heptosyltransferase
VRIDDLYELAVWLATARVYIGNDSGITHLAAAVGTPVIALFGPTDPRIWVPRGRDVCVIARPVIEDTEVGEVAAAVMRYDSKFTP